MRKGDEKVGEGTGRIKWFNSSKGYGFITLENGSDVFVHCTDVQDPPQGAGLKEKQVVQFDLFQGSKGLYAANVYQV